MATSENACNAYRIGQIPLPNLLLATTYALNKSNSSRIIVGLDDIGGVYKPMLKLGGAGSPAKYVSLDMPSWELILDQSDAITAYLQNSYSYYQEFGNPVRLLLPKHEIDFKNSHGYRSVKIAERACPMLSLEFDLENEQQQQNDQQGEPPAKKRKNEDAPQVTMQGVTFEGLKEVREIIGERLKNLEVCAGLVNNVVEWIAEFLKKEMSEDSVEKALTILKDSAAFKQYYALKRNEVKEFIKTKIEFVMFFNDDVLNIILLELYAFGLPVLAKNVIDSFAQS